MRRYRIGSAFGIPIQLDVTFLLILPVFAGLIGWRIDETAELFNQFFNAGLEVEALTGGLTPWVLGTIAAIGLFVGVLAHEFGHALVAMRYGYGIDSITLWIFGGLAALADRPEDWKHEFNIAIAGPVVSIAVGAVCAGLYLLVPESFAEPRYVLFYLGVLNVALAGFNMLPAFPMDGGRVLRALLGRNRSFARSTELAAQVGKFAAIVFGVIGLLQLNIILIGIAAFVYIAASSEQKQAAMRAAFDGITVQDVMTPAADVQAVPPDLRVDELLQRMFQERQRGYPVVRNGQPVGMVSLENAQSVREAERPAFQVEDIMSPEPARVPPSTEAMDAIAMLRQRDADRLLVVDRFGDVLGLVSEADLMTAYDVIRSGGSVNREQTGRY